MRHPYQFVEELEFVDLELEVTAERVHAFCEIVSHVMRSLNFKLEMRLQTFECLERETRFLDILRLNFPCEEPCSGRTQLRFLLDSMTEAV